MKSKPAAGSPESGDNKRFEQTVRRMLDTPPKPHGATAIKEPDRKAAGPRLGQKRGLTAAK